MRKWFKIQAKSDEFAEISIFGDIGEAMFYESVSLSDFKTEFEKVKNSSEIRVMLNSPGGSVFDGMAIYNLISSVRNKVTVEVLGMAASIASVIALAGRELVMGEGSYFMIHRPWSFAYGNSDELRKTAELLDKVSGQISDLYGARSALTDEEITEAMDATTWYTAGEAVEAGFADRVEDYGDAEIAASYDITRYQYANIPGEMLEDDTDTPGETPEKRDEKEERVRSMWFSRRESKAIASHGYGGKHDNEDDATQPPEGDSSASILTLLETGA